MEAWSPRQKKYFEVGSCSNLSDAQARRLKIRVKGEHGNYLAHTLNNTVVAPPRMLIAFLENNLQADGSRAPCAEKIIVFHAKQRLSADGRCFLWAYACGSMWASSPANPIFYQVRTP